MKTQSALPWYGSDASVAKHIAQLVPATVKHLTIPFCGGLGILPHVRARAIVANDLYAHAIHFYKQLKGYREPLIQMCQETLCHPQELCDAHHDLNDHDDTLRAWAYWTRCWLGQKGNGGTGKEGNTASIRRNAGGGTNATRLVAAATDLDEWAELFRKVEFLCQDFRNVLLKVKDQQDCGLYVDPPWVEEGGLYEHSFTTDDHRDLCRDLCRFDRSPIVLRYGDAPLIRDLYSDHYWTWIDAESRNQANAVRGEVWIMRNAKN